MNVFISGVYFRGRTMPNRRLGYQCVSFDLQKKLFTIALKSIVILDNGHTCPMLNPYRFRPIAFPVPKLIIINLQCNCELDCELIQLNFCWFSYELMIQVQISKYKGRPVLMALKNSWIAIWFMIAWLSFGLVTYCGNRWGFILFFS